jgi:protein required for attachment to host cells
MMLPNNTLVLVADGRKMLFLRNSGEGSRITLTVEASKEQANPATREQGSDSPGRTAASTGMRRSAMEQTDFHQIEEDRFAAGAAQLLQTRALNNDFDALVVIAPPRTLGELRKHYHKAVESRIIQEIHKDLTDFPIDEIAAALGNAEPSKSPSE